jgi:cholesterol transport system auxiliary component
MNRLIMTLLLFSLLLSSCGGGKQVPSRFYILEYPALEDGFVQDRDGDLLPGLVQVETPVLGQAYLTHQIALREGSHAIRYFSFNEWAVRPDQALEEILRQYLSKHPLFTEGLAGRSAGEAGYRLETFVFRLEVGREQNDFVASLDMELVLTDTASGRVVASREASHRERLAQRDLNLFARAVSEAFVLELDRFAAQLLQESPGGE